MADENLVELVIDEDQVFIIYMLVSLNKIWLVHNMCPGLCCLPTRCLIFMQRCNTFNRFYKYVFLDNSYFYIFCLLGLKKHSHSLHVCCPSKVSCVDRFIFQFRALSTLKLTRMSLKCITIEVIAAILATSGTLQTLDLTSNMCKTKGAAALAKVFKIQLCETNIFYFNVIIRADFVKLGNRRSIVFFIFD